MLRVGIPLIIGSAKDPLSMSYSEDDIEVREDLDSQNTLLVEDLVGLVTHHGSIQNVTHCKFTKARFQKINAQRSQSLSFGNLW